MSHSIHVMCGRLLLATLAVLVGALPMGVRAADPYEIHAIVSLTGGAAFLGNKEAEGMRVVEATVNKAGGIRGRQIKVVIEDDQSNPQVAVQLLNGLIAQKVPLLSVRRLARRAARSSPSSRRTARCSTASRR